MVKIVRARGPVPITIHKSHFSKATNIAAKLCGNMCRLCSPKSAYKHETHTAHRFDTNWKLMRETLGFIIDFRKDIEMVSPLPVARDKCI